jgi:hypothetical protein
MGGDPGGNPEFAFQALDSRRGGFGLAALQVQRRGVTDPSGGAKYGRGHRQDEKAGEDERAFKEGEGEDAVCGDEGLYRDAALPGDGPGGEEHWIDGGEIVVLGVQDEHEHVEDEEGQDTFDRKLTQRGEKSL